MKDTNEYIRDEVGAFGQMQLIISELSGFADILDARQPKMEAAEFWLSEHLICLTRQLNAINKAERPLSNRELQEATGRFCCTEVEPSAPKQTENDQSVADQAKEVNPELHLRSARDLSAHDFAYEIHQSVYKAESYAELISRHADEADHVRWLSDALVDQMKIISEAFAEVV